MHENAVSAPGAVAGGAAAAETAAAHAKRTDCAELIIIGLLKQSLAHKNVCCIRRQQRGVRTHAAAARPCIPTRMQIERCRQRTETKVFVTINLINN